MVYVLVLIIMMEISVFMSQVKLSTFLLSMPCNYRIFIGLLVSIIYSFIINQFQKIRLLVSGVTMEIALPWAMMHHVVLEYNNKEEIA